jgi:hypothetical protein
MVVTERLQAKLAPTHSENWQDLWAAKSMLKRPGGRSMFRPASQVAIYDSVFSAKSAYDDRAVPPKRANHAAGIGRDVIRKTVQAFAEDNGPTKS